MTNESELFDTFVYSQSEVGIAKENDSMMSVGKGKIEFDNCLMEEVLYIPNLKSNLISVKAITEVGGEVKFTKNKVFLSDSHGQTLQGYKTKNGLFQIDLKKTKPAGSFLTTHITDTVENWHKKLEHISLKNLKLLKNISNGLTLNVLDVDKLENIYEICQKAKQTRTKFNNQRRTTSRLLQIVHTDVCGPISPSTWNGKRYFITFLDDFTHYTEAYLIKSKDEVPQILKQYVRKVQSKWSTNIVKLRDNGREYINKQVEEFCKDNGIELNFTTPYTPQLNGKAERLNRTILEKLRALLFESNLDKNMWGEALLTATYLLNRTPTTVLEVTPY